ncbi:MAG: glycosyltransferase family 2 protein [Chlamydiae bacterium]|nr:glycosyltransferase family 2 protein [Chlamydiota bacterium]
MFLETVSKITNFKHLIFNQVDAFFFWYFTIIHSIYLILFILGSCKIFRRQKEVYFEDVTSILQSSSLPEISFIVPAFNEENFISKVIENLSSLSYPRKQIIIVNDGSTDATLNILQEQLDLISIPKFYEDSLATAKVNQVFFSKKNPDFVVVDKENAKGKFDALNAGINAVRNSFYVAIDADTWIDNKTFLNLIHPLITTPSLVAIGAAVKIRNGCSEQYHNISTQTFPKNILPLMQSLEYMRCFLERQGWDYLGGNFVLAGAFGIFKKEEILKIGGYVDTVAEDMEIIIRLHRVFKANKEDYRIMYLPDSVAWTHAPTTIKELGAQRINWHKGLLDCIWFHKKTLFNKASKSFGYFVYPFWLFFEALEPLIEGIGLIYIFVGFFIKMLPPYIVIFFFLLSWSFTTLFTALCILIEEFTFNRYPSLRSLLYLFFFNALESIGYRQLNLYWRIRSFFRFISQFQHIKMVNAKVASLLYRSTKGKLS